MEVHDSSSNSSLDLPHIDIHIQSKAKPGAVSKSTGKNERTKEPVISHKDIVYKPSECMKFMNVEIHPNLSKQWYAADIDREVNATGARVLLTGDMFDQSLIMWSRRLQPQLEAVQGQVELSSSKQQCGYALYLSMADEIAELVSANSLASHVTSICEMASCKLTLVIYGLKEYFKKSKRKTINSAKKKMTEITLEMALTDLLVSANCDAIKVDTPNELALHIVQVTKAIAEAPHKKLKRMCDEQVGFYMRGDNKKCVALDKDGNGVERLWQQMVAILPLSSLETSRALCGKYKTPLKLFEALQLPDGENEIANIGVARAAVPGARRRKIGPEFARKLNTLFTAEDGDIVIE